jgi:hypothetical protein
MTEPVPADQQQDQSDEDEQSLIPALLAVYALYLLWRSANDGFAGNALTVERALDLNKQVGRILTGIAQRALGSQRTAAGRAGDQLWQHADAAAQAGVAAGLQTLAEALLWTDTRTDRAAPSTSDAGGDGVTTPTREDPPTLLARLVAGATVNAAQMAAADLAGWRTKIWRTRQDNRVRDAHAVLHGQERALNEPFITAGHKLRFPHDPAAPIELRANCRCKLRFRR